MVDAKQFVPPRTWLAPMSGSTDAPFRRQAVRFGAPAVVSEMVAGEALAAARPDMVRRMCHMMAAARGLFNLRPGGPKICGTAQIGSPMLALM
ncbi:MAG: tRNA-dihydrouridine synthase [Pseudomonadota bacterium]